jgi:hypothetical protein
MKQLCLIAALLTLSSCSTVGVLTESAYHEQTVDRRVYTGSISYDVDPKELRMH